MSYKKHICIIVDCLSGGGAEKVAASLSFLLEANNYKVSVISLRDDIIYNFTGELYNLGKNESSVKWVKQIRKVMLFRQFYKKIEADFYIDFRMRNRLVMEVMLHFFVFQNKKMIMSIQHYNILYHIPKGKIFKYIYNNAKAVVGVSKDIVQELKAYHPFKNTEYVPNFADKDLLVTSTLPPENIPSNTILAIGRLNNPIKQFDKLILCYKETNAFRSGIPLLILGDGPDRLKLETLIKTHDLESSVKLMGFVSNPYDYIKHCKFLVLCSKLEGMPLVILESLALGTPVISFDCKSGPSELIEHERNGLLVKDQDFNELKNSIDLLQENDLLCNEMLKNTENSMGKFSKQEIMKYWEAIFNS